jgi:hypothetical protein
MLPFLSLNQSMPLASQLQLLPQFFRVRNAIPLRQNMPTPFPEASGDD